jgi:hypothetical protein
LFDLQAELQQSYHLSPAEAQILARRVQELIDERAGLTRWPGQITYHAIAVDEPADKPLHLCRRVPVRLSVYTTEDPDVWASEGPVFLRRLRVCRLGYQSYMQGGALTDEELACLSSVSLKTMRRILGARGEDDLRLPSRSEIEQAMARGIPHEIPVIRRLVEGLGAADQAPLVYEHVMMNLAGQLQGFSAVMVLEDWGLDQDQIQQAIGIPTALVRQYRALYAQLNRAPYAERLRPLKALAMPVLADSAIGAPEDLAGFEGSKRCKKSERAWVVHREAGTDGGWQE